MVEYQPPYQYVLDSSALFDFKNNYPENIFPSLWSNYNTMCYNKYIVCPKEVLREIKKGNDLIDWAEKYEDIFLEPCDKEIEILQSILSYYPPSTIEKYGTGPWADPLIIACAKHFRIPIITHETNDQKQYKIPPVAKHFGVKCIKLLNLFDDQSWKF